MTTSSMYTEIVRRYWREHRPRELAGMTDPESFLKAKGQQLRQRVIDLQETLEESLEPEKDYPARVGQLQQIKATAEQQAISELLPDPEDEEATGSAPVGRAEVPDR